MTRTELAIKYKCDQKTLRKFLRMAGITHRSRLTDGDYAALESLMNRRPTPAVVFTPTSPMAYI